MNVLFAVSECVPFVKSGGLADVAGALPKELKKLGIDVRVILPKYNLIPEKYRELMVKVDEITVPVGWRQQYCGIEMLEYEGITYYFLDHEYYYYRDSLYGHYDDGERFSFFCKGVLETIKAIDFQPDLIHTHDWHTGMINFLLKEEYREDSFYKHIKTVFTIHNLQFQGIFPYDILHDLLNIDVENFWKVEFHGHVSFMKAALVSADYITTVSPTYKEEIQTPYYGERLDGLLRDRSSVLTGILNGIDDQLYNPETDTDIVEQYMAKTAYKKAINKADIQSFFGLPVDEDIPVIAMVTRLTKQKGLDLVKRVLDEALSNDIQMIVLGTGEKEFEDFFRHMEWLYPTKLKAYIGFDEKLAQRIYAGSDLFLMPSKFEPCGLGQLIALRYGTIPIVRETGGLNDTVLSYREDTEEGNGFTFRNFNAHDMLNTIDRAISFYHQKDIWEKIVENAMNQDYSWAQSALKYNQLYADLMMTRSEGHVLQQGSV
ncbi:glycogen synthase GlgA [Metabacillus sediminilitoris]|uniref:Glycogen synthase n=1 Tax=Metabacillus sediminilitoris TaxID=2567941 RepID=A0A4S4C356_9BACI|nr:glycogen synthase GlgA [Metabacillus sediminilitoris]QGQ47644.1 glycogen synthase GlgA [Metabacillus sediminilitoris]THF82078.1 glycogen synthase GlgA [Metabacillus sediminilitoris]